METHEVLRFFRKNLDFTQKEALPNLDASVYSRLESGSQKIKLDDLIKIMKNLSILPEEFFSLTPIDREQEEYSKLFYFCSENLSNQDAKKRLLAYYRVLNQKYKNLRELSNYIAIKNCFSALWNEIEKPTLKELEEINNYLIKKTNFQYYDLRIIMNLSRFFDDKTLDALMIKIVKYSRNSEAKYPNNPIFSIFINVVTIRVYGKNYKSAREYIRLAKEYDKERQSFYYRINIKYLQNLLDYLESGKYQYLQRIYQYVDLLKDIDDPLAEQIETEVKLVVHGILDDASQNKIPLTLLQEKEIYLAEKSFF